MPQKIKLSTVSYFTQGNTMTGSSTPARFVADPLADLFNYRAYCAGDGGERRLVTEYYVGGKCYALTDKETIARAEFEMTQAGIGEAEAFLQKKFDAYVRSLPDGA